MSGVRAPGDLGASAAASTTSSRSKVASASVGRAPASRRAPAPSRRRRWAARARRTSSRPVRPSGARAAFDRHVADGHAAFHGERADRRAGVLDDVALGAGHADLPDRAEDQVLGAHAEAGLALDVDPHGPRRRLGERLGGQDVLDLAGADAEGQRPEGAVRGRVAVAADDRHARLGEPELGADDVDDALAGAAQREERDAELGAVALERLDLGGRERVGDAGLAADGGDVVVDRGERQVGPAHVAAGQAQAVEGLRRGHLVHEVQVDIQEGRLAVGVRRADLVVVPHLLEQRLAHHTPPAATRSPCSAWRLALTART